MISNDRQYRITKAQLEKFDKALARLLAEPSAEGVDQRISALQIQAIRAQAEELRGETAAYDTLRSGRTSALEWRSLSELPDLLIQARIALGLSQRELALRLGLKEQQIQRYEATRYSGANLTRLLEVARSLGLELPSEVSFPIPTVPFSSVLQRLGGLGLAPEFIRRRLVPPDVEGRSAARATESHLASMRAATNLARIFGWNPADLLGAAKLDLDPMPVALARFKLPANARAPHVAAYTVYAHYLALLVLQVAPTTTAVVPSDAATIREEILSSCGAVTFEGALRYVWSRGIPVLPLADAGSFHGACWRVGGRNVIVIKQGTRSLSRWLFDLLHELHHAGQAVEEEDRSVIEPVDPAMNSQDQAEWAASDFAAQIVLAGRAEELAELCVAEAHSLVPRLKAAVRRVATQERVSVDSLANYLAYRLASQGTNWWGTAANLQSPGDDPWAIARDFLLDRIDVTALSEPDREILLLALKDR